MHLRFDAMLVVKILTDKILDSGVVYAAPSVKPITLIANPKINGNIYLISTVYMYTVFTITDLPGVDMLGHTSIVVTNAEQFFCWQAYGFKLYIPPGSLPPGVDRCVLRLSVSLAGQYQFPVGHKLVSAIFWVHCSLPCRLQKQLKLEIQHCAKMMSSTKLAFVRAVCSQESLPYKFKKVEGSGSFSEQSSYGCLEVNHFSGFGVAAEGDVELLYIASLYYLKTDPSKIVIHFTITRDDKCHIAVSFGSL